MDLTRHLGRRISGSFRVQREKILHRDTDLQSGESVGLGGQIDKVRAFRRTFQSHDKDLEGSGNVVVTNEAVGQLTFLGETQGSCSSAGIWVGHRS